MAKTRNHVLVGNSDQQIEYPEQRSSEVRKRFLELIKASKGKDTLADKRQRMRSRAMRLQKTN